MARTEHLGSQQNLGLYEIHTMRLTHVSVGDVPVVDIQPVQEVRVIAHGSLSTLVCQFQYKRQGGVVQRGRRRPCNRARHIGDAVVHDTINAVGRVIVGCRPGRFKTAALVNGNIYHHRAPLHSPNQFTRNQFGSRGTRNQNSTNNEICRHGLLSDCVLG